MHLNSIDSHHGVIPDELEKELQWARQRPTSRYSSSMTESESKYEDALTTSEHKYLVEYRHRWPGVAYLLNQDPSSGHGHKSNDKALFTLISNMGLVWLDSPSSKRWLTPTECLVCLGSSPAPLTPNCFVT